MVTFYCYDDGEGTPDETGQRPNLWDRWYAENAESSKQTRGRHDTVLRMLRSVTIWQEPFFHSLGGKGIEQILIHTKERQWRILGFRNDALSEFTVVGTCYHKDRRYYPKDAQAMAERRMKEILNGTAERIRCDPPPRRK